MTARADDPEDGGDRARLHAFSGGMFFNKRVRRILSLAGYDIALGLPARGHGQVAVWGRTGPSMRGRLIAQRFDAGLVTVEDAFLRSVLTGRSGAVPMGLMIDPMGVYFDGTSPSALENVLNFAALDGVDLLARATRGIARLQAAHLSKYNAFDPAETTGEAGYILVIDQTRGDASIRLGGADSARFQQMLAAARAENPGKTVLIKTHPEVTLGYRHGHFSADDLDGRTRFLTAPLSPYQVLAGADQVYAVTSLMGFEAILAGHRPHLFGAPFYAGWGLSEDRQIAPRRKRALSVEALFAAAMLVCPTWYDPYRDRLCEFEDVADSLEAQARAWREDHQGWDGFGLRLWKRRPLRQFFGPGLRFGQIYRPGFKTKKALVWANQESPVLRAAAARAGVALARLEDGFIRSRGLGAELVPPLSLVVDDLGIYYDPTRPSRLEALLNDAANLSEAQLARAGALRARLNAAGVSKYNIGTLAPEWPGDKRRILVPGQVEDDASIRLGAGEIDTNLGLLARVRADNPDAFVIYKPHPDVQAGLRPGVVAPGHLSRLADAVADGVDAIAAIDAVDEVWTMTSTLGFEALVRGTKVTCLGRPFYGGWGLTTDLGAGVERRVARPSIEALIHQVLIAYPRYFDPVSGLACPVEIVVDRLADAGSPLPQGPGLRALAKAQGLFASFAPWWR